MRHAAWPHWRGIAPQSPEPWPCPPGTRQSDPEDRATECARCNRCAVDAIVRRAAAALLALLWGGSPMRAKGAPDGRALSPRRHDARERYLNERFQVATTRSPGRGLCVVAERAFAPGDVILSSEPFASVLFPALQDERCNEWFARADKLSRCASCKLARFARARSPSAPRFRRVCRLSRMPCMLSGCCWLLCSTTAMRCRRRAPPRVLAPLRQGSWCG